MGKDNKKEQLENIGTSAQQTYKNIGVPDFSGMTGTLWGNYNQGVGQQMGNYSDIMGGYQNFFNNLKSPTNFSAQMVGANRPQELSQAYGYLNEAAPGYRTFAETGGYSPTDIQELRARGISPIRAAYGNTMMELNRARALGGAGGATNYIAAASKAQRELPEQMASAMTGVNAELANAIRQGKLAGLAGLTGIGGEMGGLAGAESGRQLQAAIANQNADLQRQQLTEQSLQNLRASQLAALGGQTSLYGTTPAMASMFGNQALQGYGLQNQAGLGWLDAALRAYGGQESSTPWWKTALAIAGTAAPYIAMAASSREVKHDIKRVKNTSRFAKALKKLPLYTWKYNGDETTHFGPIAEEFKEKLGIGDGKTMHLADVMGVMLAAAKEA